MAELVALVGPTASGKTDLAIEVAEMLPFDVEVIGLDSRQVYRQLEVGTAKPSAEERARVAHHALDLIDIDETYDAHRYRQYVERLIPQLEERGVVPLFVGGAGFYLRAIAEGFHDLEYDADRLHEIRNRIQALDDEAVAARLRDVDPTSAEKLHVNDRYRQTRALELYELSGKPASELEADFEPRPILGRTFRLMHLSPPRAALHERIERRARAWVDGPWREEVERLLADGWSSECPGLGVLGYPEIRSLLTGELTLDETTERIVVATRRYAKQQETWFRKVDAVARGDVEALRAPLADALNAARRGLS